MLQLPVLQPASAKFSQWRDRIKHLWPLLSVSQKLYLCTLLLLPFSLALSTCVALAALAVDFWPRFAAVWHSLAGKAIILLFYAIIANFALALSASTVNDVTGLEAALFPYAHNAAILLNVPVFAFGISLVALVVIQLLLPFYILLLVLLRAGGFHQARILRAHQYPILTLVVRFGICLLVLVQGINAVNDSEQEPEPSTLQHPESLPDGVIAPRAGGYGVNVKQFIAYFIYHVEADSYSRCLLPEGAKAVDMNAYQYAEIKRDRSQPFGFSFTVKACQSPGISPPKNSP